MTSDKHWDRSYEFKAISLLAIGFGLVGLDRFIILPLFPTIAEDLGLSYQDMGLIAGVLALTWGIAAVVAGRLSDLIGYKRVLVTTTIVFSVLVASSGLATGLFTLLLIRGLMGLAEGGFVPASIVATVRAAKPTRVGTMVGIQQMAMPLVGLFLAPLIAIGLLKVLPSWEWVFAVVAIPGFIVAYLFARTLKNPSEGATIERARPAATPRTSFRDILISFREVLRYRNVVFATLGMLAFFSSLHTLSTFMPSYLTDHMGLSGEQMGLVFSSLGVGGVIGMVVVPAISDRLGRKPVMAAAMLLGVAVLVAVVSTDATIPLLVLCLFTVSAAVSGVVAITIGPFMSASVPASIAATATGLAGGLGEIAGGAVTPAVAGAIAESFGIEAIPVVSLIAASLGALIVLFGMKEPKSFRSEVSQTS